MKFVSQTSAAMILGFTSAVMAAPAATAPATQAASQPAVDRSSPEKTWASVCVALKAGDLQNFRAAFYNRNALAHEFMDDYSDMTVTTFDLARATALLGDEGRAMGKRFENVYTETVQSGENRKLEITGETAKWTHAEKPKDAPDDVIYFRRIKGEWLIDTVETYDLDSDSGHDGAENMIKSVPQVTAMLKQVAADIRAKKITTVDQMRKRLSSAK